MKTKYFSFILLIILGANLSGSPVFIERLDPKMEIAHQLELLKAGDIDELKKHFTERIRGKITEELIAEAQQELPNYTIDDLVAIAEYGKFEGMETVTIKMKNNRTLTTLIWMDGKWLADTLWFK